MPGVRLTKKQSACVQRLVALYACRCLTSSCIPNQLKAQIQLLDHMIQDGIGFDQSEFDVLVWLLDLYFEAFGDKDIDPLAEQAYAKIVGHWPFDEPWYDRMINVQKPLPHKGVRDYKLGT